MTTPKKIFWTILGFGFLVFCFLKIQYLFVAPRSLVYHFMGEFFSEPKNSLDAVIIGASQGYDSWSAPVAFSQYGMTVWSFCCPRLPAQALIYLMEEARKAQPDALLIIALNLFHNQEITDVNINWSSNYLPYSLNRAKMVNALAGEAGYDTGEKLRYLFPLLRFHSDWTQKSSFYFLKPSNGLKSAMFTDGFAKNSVDISDLYQTDGQPGPLGSRTEDILSEVLDYCDRKKISPLFVAIPEALGDKEGFIGELNTLENIIRERGYEVADFLHAVEDTGIDPKIDFTDPRHLNVHGTLKYTPILARYLHEHYDFADKRGMPGFESWEDSVRIYTEKVGPYTLPFERENVLRDYTLPAPKVKKGAAAEQTVSLSWSASKGADVYEIYRANVNENENSWTYLASVGTDTRQYTDSGLSPDQVYRYTVVPKSSSGAYGNFRYSSVRIRTPKTEPAEP